MSAPVFRSVNALNGDVVRPSKIWDALSEATEFCREVDGARELQARVAELQAEVAELRTLLAVARNERDVAKAEGRRGW